MSRWDWLGLRERRWKTKDGEEVEPAKTAWDWLQLLIVPAMLAAIAIAFNASQTSRDRGREDRRIREDRALARADREDENLQRYFDRMSNLLLSHRLLHASWRAPVRDVARNITLATLRELDADHKTEVLRFLSDAGVLHQGIYRPTTASLSREPVVELHGADLSGVDLRGTVLYSGTALQGTVLRGARFDRMLLDAVDFDGADLRGASFKDTILTNDGFDGADLTGVAFDRASIGAVDADSTHDPVALWRACLSGASFKGASLFDVRFDDSYGRGLDLRGARRARSISLSGAVLTDVRGVPRGWGARGRYDAAYDPCRPAARRGR